MLWEYTWQRSYKSLFYGALLMTPITWNQDICSNWDKWNWTLLDENESIKTTKGKQSKNPLLKMYCDGLT